MTNVSFKDFLIRSKMNFNKASIYKEAYDKIMESGLFDKKFYLSTYPHIAKSNMDPLVHYMFFGYKEGKFPSIYFDVVKYTQKHPEIIEKELNPLVYYVMHEKEEDVELNINPIKFRYDKLINTNLLFLNNYSFDNFKFTDSQGNELIGEPLVSIIILNRNGLSHLKTLFENFEEKTNYSNYEIILVDNNSDDGSIEFLEELANDLPIRIIKNTENISFSKCNNDAAKIANGEYLLLMNNDIEPTFGWLNELVGTYVFNDNVGAVGAKLVFPYYYNMSYQIKSFTIQHAGVKCMEDNNFFTYSPYHANMFSGLIFDKTINKTKDFFAVTAATVLIKKSIFFELDGFDEEYFYGYEDMDLMFKLRNADYRIIYDAPALLFHHESPTRHDEGNYSELIRKNLTRLNDKWGDFLFKTLLEDKLDLSFFATDKRLKITFIADNLDNDFNEDIDTKNDGLFNNEEVAEFLDQSNIIPQMLKIFNDRKYNSSIISDLNDTDIGSDTDIVISLSLEYNIANAVARKNLIKILWISEENYNSSTKKEINRIKDYDIVISINQKILNTICNDFKDVKCFLLHEHKAKDYDDYVDRILNIVREVYLD